jgi:hypothetical protein
MTEGCFLTSTKQSHSKDVKKINMWKKMGEGEKGWASKACLVTFVGH